METKGQLVALRGSYRGSFTKFAKKVDDFLKSNIEDFDSCTVFYAQLQEKYSKVENYDKQILAILQEDDKCNQTMLDEEIDEAENYNDTFINLKVRLEKILNSRNEMNESLTEIESNSKSNYKLPKIELQKFDGNLKNYLSFWGLFKKIHEDSSILDIDKFHYLIQSTLKGSRAREVVESFPVTADNYQQVIECIQSRFGREDVLIEVYVRELLSLVLSNALGQEHKLPIVKLYDRIEAQLRSLKMLGVTSDKYASMLYPLVESCLPIDLLRIWERHLNSVSLNSEERNCNKLETLMQFLRNEIEGEEKINLATSGFGFENKVKKTTQNKSRLSPFPNRNIPTGLELFTSSQVKSFKDQTCIFCEKPHASTDCRKAENMTYDQKKQIIIKRGACFRCFRLNHISASCRAKTSCNICGKSHHQLICRNNTKPSDSNPSGVKNENVASEQVLANVSSSPCVLLQTFTVILRGEEKSLKVRAIIDSASQRSYILRSTAEKVGYQSIKCEKLKHSLFGGTCTSVYEHDVYKAHVSSIDNDYHCNFDVLGQSTICQTIPPTMLCQDELLSLGINLNDCQGPIELLIGADIAGKLMTGELKNLRSGLTAVKTKLGWTVLGRTTQISEETENLIITSMLNRDVRITDLWELDSLGITDPAEKQSKSELEELAKEHFVKTLQKDSDGRYTVSLPWIVDHQVLPNNKVIAERRLKSTMRTLENKDIIEEYEDVFNQWLGEEIIEEVEPVELEKTQCHYLPHRAVIKEHSTTRIRPVFDASAKEKNNLSLNDCLEKGSNYIELIPSILNKFRLYKFGVVADIKKAFLQIGVKEEDRDFLRFLWWEGGNPDKVKVFRHRRVVFGVNCSPFLLGATLNFHLDQAPDYLQETASKLKGSMYVDNCVTSCKSEEELVKFIQQSKEIMASACFDLRGWTYNGQKSENLCNEIVPVLGLNWLISEDTLSCNFNFCDYDGMELTKRTILSLAGRIFDPIGFLSPVTLIPKLLIQKCWQRKILWDSKLPFDIEREFIKWKKQLPKLNEISIPRCLIRNEDNKDLTLHVFCDASEKGYATCIYLRSEGQNSTDCQLIQARSRVAPLKPLSISRLELLACSIGARLCHTVKESLGMKDVATQYWSDSSNALYWIKKNENWATFVFNRVKEIRDLSNPDDWKHISGQLNPADLPSRGCSIENLIKSCWWEGPPWLKTNPENWPVSKVFPDEEVVNCEKKKTVICALNTEKEEPFFMRYSSYFKIVRILAWVRRFVSNLRNRKCRTTGELSVEEMKRAELALLKMVQKEEFSGRNSDRLRKLHPVVDKDGLIRVKTLVFRSKDSEDFRLPIVLPGDHYVVQKLIEWKHKELSHAGVQIVMNDLREKYWILRCRKSIRQVTLRCSRCRRFTVTSIQPESPPLSEDRIREANVFEVIGVDLAGPLYLKNKQKCWIVLYTCAVYRTIHLELVTSMSTEAFLQTFRRFVARRGRPSVIYSDNGANFGGASRIFSDPELAKIRDSALVKGIKWKFIPPASPWWGGWWERLIGCVKRILRRVLGRASLNFEELLTIVCEVEGLINSRPLTTLTEDPEDLVPLTPNMFLQGVKQSGLPDLDNLEKVDLRKRLRYLLKLRQDLRSRFRIEYLGQLKNLKGNAKNDMKISVGDIVLVGHDNQKRFNWPLAKVVEVYPSEDGPVRVVKIKTEKGFLIRPVQRLYPLEICSLEENTLIRDKCPIKTVKQAKDALKKSDSVKTEFKEPRVSSKGRLIKTPNKLNL